MSAPSRESAFSAVRSIRFTAGISISGAPPRRMLNLTRIYVIPAHVPPHRQQPFASAFHRFAMMSFAVADQPDGARPISSCDTTGPPTRRLTLRQFHQRGYPPSELFFIVGADAFIEIARLARLPEDPRLDALRRGLAAGAPRWCTAAADCRRWLRAWSRPPIEPLAEMRPVDHFDRRADAPTCHPRPSVSAAADGQPIDGMVTPAVEQHIEQHGLYASGTPGSRRSDTTRGHRRQAGCMAKADTTAQAGSPSAPGPARRRGGGGQEGRTSSWCSTCGRRRGSLISSSSARGRTRGRSARSPTR